MSLLIEIIKRKLEKVPLAGLPAITLYLILIITVCMTSSDIPMDCLKAIAQILGVDL
jgi:hypothetical protein